MIEIKNLQYQDILKISNLTLQSGKISIIYGRSGAGKSTLFNLIFGNDYNYHGDILINQENFKNKDSQLIRNKIGYVSQQEELFMDTPRAEFKYISKILKLKFDQNKMNKFLQVACFDLDLDFPIDKLSGGEKQRLVLARALYLDKEIYLLDETTSALDGNLVNKLIDKMYHYIKESNKTLVIIAHDEKIINNPKFSKYQIGGSDDN